jgi:hypothetical protein
MKKTQPAFIVASVVAILIPASYIFYLILKSGELSTNDYWKIISNFYSIDGFSTNPLNWLVRSNEHFVVIPSIVYAINIIATKGSNLGLSLTTFVFALIQSLLLILLVPPSLKQSRSLFLLLLLCISIFIFTPAAAHNWMRGFSGVAWIGANLFVTASIFCLTKLAHYKHRYWAIGSVIFGLLGSVTYSTALALWPVLCTAVMLMRFRLRIVLLYVSFAVFVCSIYVLTYKTPSHHPSLSKLSISDTFTYVPIYLGAIFTSHVNIALSIGIIGLIAAIGFAGYWLSPKANSIRACWLPWIALQAYAVLSALMAAVSRSGFGIEQARSSRYASLPSLFWLSLSIVVVLWLRQLRPNPGQYWSALTPFFAVLTVLILSMYRVGTEEVLTIARRASLQPLVILSVQLGTSDADIVKEVVSPAPEEFLRLTDALKLHSLVPFTRDIRKNNFCAALDKKIDSNLLTTEPQNRAPGFFDNLTKLTPEVARVEGWSGDSSGTIRCIAILNQDNLVRGFALSGFQRLDVAKSRGSSYEFSGWKGYVHILPEDEILTAYASFKNRKNWVALQNFYSLSEITIDKLK